MQILHFDWQRYWRSNSPRVAKSATLSFVLFPNKYFFNLHLLTLLLPFLSDKLGDTKTIRPFVVKGHGSIAHSASPHGLLTRSPLRATGLIVKYYIKGGSRGEGGGVQEGDIPRLTNNRLVLCR